MARDGEISYVNGTINFEGSYRPQDVPYVTEILNNILLGNTVQLILNFKNCTRAFPNSMLPLIAMLSKMRSHGHRVYAVLPTSIESLRHFHAVNWAYYISPNQYKPSDDISDKHLVVKNYSTIEEHVSILKLIIDVILGTIEAPRSSVAALEWSISEIMDNVLTHSNATTGGFVQLSTFPNHKKFAFCVADCGRGILESLREGYPNLQSDRIAIEQAVRAGITRNKEIGQGNGLSGSLNIAIKSGGRFVITSGSAEVAWIDNDIKHTFFDEKQYYSGTVVDFQIPYGYAIDLAKILNESTHTPSYSTTSYSPSDYLDTHYLSPDGRHLLMRMVAETVGFGTRLAGKQMRVKCKNLMAGEPGLPVLIDWDGIQVIASSYADEFIGKLFVELGPLSFMSRIRQINTQQVVRSLLDRAIMQRTSQTLSGYDTA